MRSKKMIAMLLAGGQGSRLSVLTERIAKPAVPFGGKYRIIDFPLSNCVNSDIDTVGVLTQYQPLELNSYIGSGQPWDLDRNNGGVFVLPPYVKGKSGEWYSGTANAIYQNIPFIDQYAPEYVLILSGDHIYKMDYSSMLRSHEASGADGTIAVIQVPIEDASRYGIMNTDENGRITDFDEKPTVPKSTNASMGIYIFTWRVLKTYLQADACIPGSSNDFGKDIIPAMIKIGQKIMAYQFHGYWKDVGTIESLWQANMDLLEKPPRFELYDGQWRIYSRNPIMPPHYISANAHISNSLVTEGAIIKGSVEHSIIFAGAVIEEGAQIIDSIIMPSSRVGKNTRIVKTILSEQCVVGQGCTVGALHCDKYDPLTVGITVVADQVSIPPGTIIQAGSIIPRGTYKNEGGAAV